MTNFDSRSAASLVREDNSIADAAYTHEAVDYSEHCALDDPRLARVDRIRLLTERGYPYFDVSYVWGTLKDGRHVRISGFDGPLPRKGLKGALVQIAKEHKVHAHGLHMLDSDVISILWG